MKLFTLMMAVCVWQAVCRPRSIEPRAPLGAYAKPIYLRGTVVVRSDQDTWEICDEKNMLEVVNDDEYELEIELAEGVFEFKISDEKWGSPDLGANGFGDQIRVNQPYKMMNYPGCNNLSIDIEKSGNYRFRLDATDVKFPTIVVEPTNSQSSTGRE